IVSDTLPGAPSGWTLQGTWNVVSETGTPPVDLDLAPGGHQIWAGKMPAGTTYSYTVTGVLVPSSTAAPIGECDPQTGTGGLVNTATVSSGEATDSDNGCVDLQSPPVDVTKDATSVAQQSDGTWLVTYLVSVANTSDELAAFYNLTDATDFGTDATEDELEWAPADASGTPTGPFTGTTPIAQNKQLAASATDYYVVRVTATIADDAWQVGADGVVYLQCKT